MRQGDVLRRNRRARPLVQVPSAFTGFRFPPEVIVAGGPLVPALRPVLPGPGRAPRRARYRRGPRDFVPVGAAVHAAVDRRGPPVPARPGH